MLVLLLLFIVNMFFYNVSVGGGVVGFSVIENCFKNLKEKLDELVNPILIQLKKLFQSYLLQFYFH